MKSRPLAKHKALSIIFIISVRIVQFHCDFVLIFSSLVGACLQLAHVRALQLVDQACTVWKFADTHTPAGHQLQDCIRCLLALHPLYFQTTIITRGPATALGIWHSTEVDSQDSVAKSRSDSLHGGRACTSSPCMVAAGWIPPLPVLQTRVASGVY